MRRRFCLVGVVVVLLAPLVGFALASSVGAVDPPAQTVTVRVELDLPNGDSSSGPAVFQVTADLPVATIDVTAADLVSNPSGWGGNVDVHLDLNADTVAVSTADVNDFETAKVIITGLPITSVTNLTDTLWESSDTGHMNRSIVSSESQPTELSWASVPDTDSVDLADGGAATFSFTTATLSSSQPTVVQGDDVLLTGTGCASGTGSATISGLGGSVSVTGVAADGSGTWTAHLSSAALAPDVPGGAAYSLTGTCTSDETGNFAYVSTLLSVAAPSVTSTTSTTLAPTTTAAVVPAVAATPAFTG